LQLDPSAYLQLDGQGSLGATASGFALATATGDILEAAAYGPGVFRLRAGPSTGPDYGIVQAHPQPCAVAQSPPGIWTLATGDSVLELTAAPLRFRLLHHGVPVLQSCTDLRADGSPRLPSIGRLRRGGQWLAALALASGEPVYGLGEQGGPLNKRGQRVRSSVTDAQSAGADRARAHTPFAWGPGGRAAAKGGAWGVFVHTVGSVTHGVGDPEWSPRSYALVVDDDALDLFLFAAGTPAEIVGMYTRLTGRAPIVPAWSLGLWIACDHGETPEAAFAIAEQIREHRIPCDVLALDHRATTPPAAAADDGSDRATAAPMPSALARIKAHDLRICARESPQVVVGTPLYQELAALGYLLTDGAGMPAIRRRASAPAAGSADATSSMVQDSAIVDLTHPGAFAWWRDAHEALFADGAALIASDDGEDLPENAIAVNGDSGSRLANAYALLHHQCLFDATARFQRAADAPPVIGAHAGWAGSQRYAIQTGGAEQSDWEGLAASIRGALSSGMSGAPYRSSAIGGTYGPPPTAELFVRWLQAGVFGSHVSVRGTQERLPWAHGPMAEAIARKWLAFRYRLIPYLLHAAGEARRTGLPVMRAMALAFPGHAPARACETQFMCGETLLVAPIVAEDGEVEIALPPGAWHDLNSRQRFPGQRVLRYRAALDQFPVFGREGFALPLGPAVAHTGQLDPLRPLDALWVFGRPAQPLAGFAQAAIAAGPDGAMAIDAAPELEVELFGDASGLPVTRRSVTTDAA
jgi:alpha-D-xyloside xylohydrolase